MKLLVILAFVLCISVGKHSSNSTLFVLKFIAWIEISCYRFKHIRQPSIAMILYIFGLVLPLVYNEFAELFLSPISTLIRLMLVNIIP